MINERLNDSFFTTAKEYMPKDKEVLELDEYIDLFVTVLQKLRKDSPSMKSEALDVLRRNPQDSSLAAMVTSLQDSGPDDLKCALQKLFARQDELFLSQNSNISSSYVSPFFLPHYHKNGYFDVIYAEKGRGVCFFRDIRIELSEGDVLIVPPEVEHGEGALSGNDRILTSAIRKNSFLEMFLQVFSENWILFSFFSRILSGDESIRYIHFPASDREKDKRLSYLFSELYREQREEPAYHNEMCNTIMRAIFVHLLRYYEKDMVLPEQKGALWRGEYAGIFQYMEENYRTVSMDDLSAEFHYSKRQLIRIIKLTTGSNFSTLIRDMKLRHAKFLLKETSLTVEEVTAETGYENVSSFIRLFKKAEGLTPSAFRKTRTL